MTPEHFADYPEKTKAPMLKLLEMQRKRKAGIPIHSSNENEDEKRMTTLFTGWSSLFY
jgi:hypothetical protein